MQAVSVSLIFFLIIALLFPLFAVNTAAADDLSGKTVLAFGDSLTQGTVAYASSNDTYVDMLEKDFSGVDFINAGVRGNSTYNALVRFDADVLAKNPDIVIICFGMNDQAWEVPYNRPIQSMERYVSQLTHFITTLQEKGVDVILMTPNPVYEAAYTPTAGNNYEYGLMDDYCDAMRRLALKYNCGLIDMNREITVGGISKYVSGDGIHQTVAGHRLYADCIGDYLNAVYKGENKAAATVKVSDEKGETVAQFPVIGAKDALLTVASPWVTGYSAQKNSENITLSQGLEVKFDYTTENEVILSQDKKYTVVGKTHTLATHIDDGVRLTDGIKKTTDGGNGMGNFYSGYSDSSVVITVDLGEVTKSNVYTIYGIAYSWGISPASSVVVSASADGTNFAQLGKAKRTETGAGDGTWKLFEYTLETEGTPAEARYIRFAVTPTGGHFWADEVEVALHRDLVVTDPEYTLGDVNNDGRIDSFDYLLVRAHILKLSTLKDEMLLAADVTCDKKIDSFDYLLIRAHILGLKEIK